MDEFQQPDRLHLRVDLLDGLPHLDAQQEVVDGEGGQEEAKLQRGFVGRLRPGPGVEAGEAEERVGEGQRLQGPPGLLSVLQLTGSLQDRGVAEC